MKQTIKTKGMHCTSCEALIIDALEDIGVTKVKADFKSGKIEVDTNISKEKIVKVIEEEGYKVL